MSAEKHACPIGTMEPAELELFNSSYTLIIRLVSILFRRHTIHPPERTAREVPTVRRLHS